MSKDPKHPKDLGTQLEAVANEMDEAVTELRGAAERARHLEQIVRLRQPSIDKLKTDVADLKREKQDKPDE